MRVHYATLLSSTDPTIPSSAKNLVATPPRMAASGSSIPSTAPKTTYAECQCGHHSLHYWKMGCPLSASSPRLRWRDAGGRVLEGVPGAVLMAGNHANCRYQKYRHSPTPPSPSLPSRVGKPAPSKNISWESPGTYGGYAPSGISSLTAWSPRAAWTLLPSQKSPSGTWPL